VANEILVSMAGFCLSIKDNHQKDSIASKYLKNICIIVIFSSKMIGSRKAKHVTILGSAVYHIKRPKFAENQAPTAGPIYHRQGRHSSSFSPKFLEKMNSLMRNDIIFNEKGESRRDC
jgi:hypothetical protein